MSHVHSIKDKKAKHKRLLIRNISSRFSQSSITSTAPALCGNIPDLS